MLSQKLSKDTDIHFRVENGVIKRLTKNQKKISNAFRNTTKSKTITVKKKEYIFYELNTMKMLKKN